MAKAFLGLGSNLGERQKQLDFAVERLQAHPQITDLKVAKYLETEPVGYLDQDKFLNTVVELSTTLAPHELLAVAQEIEQAAKRVRVIRWGPRTLDVDILLYDALCLDEPDLTIPHPRMREREFVLAPLAQIAPDVAIPPDGRTARQLLDQLRKSGCFDASND
ncbi:2-amino-4-hydroxy-6-hydroxymethyldihydropteridine diphosphokinase [Dethiobacter alkaliphilus]|uniref:2-amino-4-hydroxy-6-hydroxymethyldihydropteridine diphosphokinase n=1 Tax=Dethiobacter alkaliphilus AHT 1 TaxID=555088 RepID=C0GCX9_DETAL|nr:2-amino-4-hydroxy-6-hydroxymethyldihydropteridine diphosphokinase [Dethiobacter alkaliphilus]EEG79064.1 2-amino-4-hydroxy-6-hydroxymethyldihydropteridine pyrophosphokinase [Dethiobacter alkaliphilus AHT 1]MCW3490514.1 2-amino-4-hydroxy-6-hydroxymethyldihydropteridine diphosphokinase [Dethiobacter alkaliphilus]